MSNKGRVELFFEVVGKDSISAVLKKASEQISSIGKATGDVAKKSFGLARIKGVFENMSTNWTELRSKIDLASQAVEKVGQIYRGTVDFLKSGEISHNIGVTFKGLAGDVEGAMERARDAATGLIDDTKLKGLVIRARTYGASMEQAFQLIGAASRNAQSGVGEFDTTFERMIGSVLSGEAQEIKVSGAFVDLKKALADHVKLHKLNADSMTEEEKVKIRLQAVIDALERKYRELGVRFTLMKTDAQEFDVAMDNLQSTLEEGIATGFGGTAEGAEKTGKALQKLGPVGMLLLDTFGSIGPALKENKDQLVAYQEQLLASGFSMAEAEEHSKNMDRSMLILGVTTEKLRRGLDILGVSAQDQAAIFGQAVPGAFGDYERAIKQLLQTATGIDNDLKRQLDGWVIKLQDFPHKTLSPMQALAEQLEPVGKKIFNTLFGDSKEAKKASKGGKSRRKEELQLLAQHAQAMADNQNALAGELHKHKTAKEKIEDKSFKWEKTRKAALQLEALRHDKALKGIEQTNLAEVLDRRSSENEAKKKAADDLATMQQSQAERQKEINAQRQEAERQRIEAERALIEEGLSVQQAYGEQLQSLGVQNKSNAVSVLGTLSAATAQTARDFKALKTGSPQAIAALGAVATASIRDTKTQAITQGLFAQATALLELSRGNIPGYIAGQASAAGFFALAGSGTGGKKKTAKMSGIASGGAQATGALTAGGGAVTVNVQGFVGSSADLSSSIQSGLSTMQEAGFQSGGTA